MNLNVIEGSFSFSQLLTKLREAYKMIKKSVIKLKRAKSVEKIEYLKETLKYVIISESMAKRLTAKSTREAVSIAQNIADQVSSLKIQDEKQIAEIEGIFDRLVKLLESVDRSNLTESRKSQDLARLDRGAIDEIKVIKYKVITIARQRKAANDNFILRQQQYRKAA